VRLRIIASIGALAVLGFAAPAHAEISSLPKTVAEQIAAMGPISTRRSSRKASR
jgi:hypothetical protein